ncbi:MAG: hypothetical protein A2504_12075 [Bdellovibrionales bacterium RIFOXYD12_FULL_39_22]|nr:MAG: hypothetical protein A2385_01795 [Bdellovibrionales bacterium RIFOXYB1_FULL_39_21]OFZ46431.1 MAG: hypothetical protein A2404_09030 [Bdellovibrionales bacterium RIFOXYC1_FULL_39_130]OFZ75037.1 MAG: hypothetical protein A2560_10645 [Bdellovibrionales bacterium RIFOXYD1_FULL_39_84]OFZ94856.1 MAG: hypothetical protein A2504_12075 [Bdellovibrionales bacterium RIFOXYD12_FULL_39_22]HLE12149.1 hypothetical protein [Bacteriovoracaceae bacterium]
MNKKFSTSTLITETTIVPWLAAHGSLAYTPESPPDRDYYFQYTWIIPDIFNEKINKREHRYFGYNFRDLTIGPLFAFWNNCRMGVSSCVYRENGQIFQTKVAAPVAIYEHEDKNIFIQHGSYQFINEKNQPELQNGVVYLYRGIGTLSKPTFI